MIRLRRAAMALLVFALAGCTTTTRTTASPSPSPSASASASATPFSTATLHWTPCNTSFQCTTMQVPLDYSDPNSTKISLALMRLPASDQAHRIGSVLINPGGPGGSGIDFLKQASFLFGKLNQRFDIVGFDPRGVGASTPVRCVDSKQMDAFIAVNPAPTTPGDVQSAITASQNFAIGCAQMSGKILPFLGTTSAARDMDQMREALGDAKLSYIGFSYGSLLGATYADLFPTHVRALVLDGAVDPALTTDDVSRTQAAGFEANLNSFLADCAARPACEFNSGGQPGPALDALLASIKVAPMTVGTRHLGIGEAYLGVLAALYSPDTWSILATALHNAESHVDKQTGQTVPGNGKLLLALADSYDARNPDGTYSNELEANTAINCDDGPAPGSVAHLQQLAVQLQSISPHFGIASAFGPLTCDFWPVQPTGRHALTAAGAPPMLVIGGTNDPATPYSWAQGMSRELKSAILVTRTGDGHVSYDKSVCIRTLVDAYLVDPTKLPAAGTVCPTGG